MRDGDTDSASGKAYLMQWASSTADHTSMPTVDELLADGWEIVAPSLRYPNSVLMRKAA